MVAPTHGEGELMDWVARRDVTLVLPVRYVSFCVTHTTMVSRDNIRVFLSTRHSVASDVQIQRPSRGVLWLAVRNKLHGVEVEQGLCTPKLTRISDT